MITLLLYAKAMKITIKTQNSHTDVCECVAQTKEEQGENPSS